MLPIAEDAFPLWVKFIPAKSLTRKEHEKDRRSSTYKITHRHIGGIVRQQVTGTARFQ